MKSWFRFWSCVNSKFPSEMLLYILLFQILEWQFSIVNLCLGIGVTVLLSWIFFFFFRYWNNNFAIVNLCSDFWNDMFAVINLCSYVGVMVIFIQILEWWLCIVARQRSLQKRPNLLHNVHSFNQWFLASFDACVLRYLWYLWPAFKF